MAARERYCAQLSAWPRVGAVPYQALPLLRFFAYNICARKEKKVRKGEGEPGNEASLCLGTVIVCFFGRKLYCCMHCNKQYLKLDSGHLLRHYVIWDLGNGSRLYLV
jgi:hypothetical protein